MSLPKAIPRTVALFFMCFLSAIVHGDKKGETITYDDLLLTEHIVSLHRNAVPSKKIEEIKERAIEIISQAFQAKQPKLSKQRVREKAKQWLRSKLDELDEANDEA